MRYRRPQNYKEKLDNYKKDEIIIEKYSENLFKNQNELHLEIGMGRGDFITEHARRHPNFNYIGIEKQAPLLIAASQKIEEGQIENLKLMSFDARNIQEIFGNDCIDGIYLNFSDPWSKQRYAKRRLTHCKMLQKYECILKNGSFLKFKTDNKDLFDFSLEEIKSSKFVLLEANYNLYENADESQRTDPRYIQTEYEKKFVNQGKTIYYLECALNKV